jgi:hypothetical protein
MLVLLCIIQWRFSNNRKLSQRHSRYVREECISKDWGAQYWEALCRARRKETNCSDTPTMYWQTKFQTHWQCTDNKQNEVPPLVAKNCDQHLTEKPGGGAQSVRATLARWTRTVVGVSNKNAENNPRDGVWNVVCLGGWNVWRLSGYRVLWPDKRRDVATFVDSLLHIHSKISSTSVHATNKQYQCTRNRLHDSRNETSSTCFLRWDICSYCCA